MLLNRQLCRNRRYILPTFSRFASWITFPQLRSDIGQSIERVLLDTTQTTLNNAGIL